MSVLLSLLALILHATLLIAAAPVVSGFVRVVEARLSGRRGPATLQPWRDLARLARKQPVVADSASFVTLGAPVVALAVTLPAALLVPSFTLGMASAPAADLLVVAGLLASARVALALAAMDAGTGFGGMGASRAMLVALFSEPALLLVALIFVALVGTSNLDAIAAALREGAAGARLSIGVALVVMAMVALAANGRLPVDDPAAACEPGMAGGAQSLEYSGWLLAMIEFSGSLRLLTWFGLLGTLFMPMALAPAGAGPLAWLPAMLGWALRTGAGCVAIGVLELAAGRMRLFRVPAFLGAALLLGLLGAVFLFAGGRLA